MIRFGTRTLFFVFVLVAAWCSTFSRYSAGSDVRASILLIVFLAAGFAAVYSRGTQRAFWAGFFMVMLVTGGMFFQGSKYIPNFSWRLNIQPSPPMSVQFSPPAAPYTPPSDPAAPVPLPPTPPMVTMYPVLPAQASNYQFTMAVNATIEAVWTLVLATIVGLLAARICAASSRDRDAV